MGNFEFIDGKKSEGDQFTLVEKAPISGIGVINIYRKGTSDIVAVQLPLSVDVKNNQNLKQVSNRLKLSHPHLLQIVGYERNSSEHGTDGLKPGQRSPIDSQRSLPQSFYFEISKISLENLLLERIGTNKLFTQEDLMALLKGVASTLSFLQENNISHGDIHPSTIFFDMNTSAFQIHDRSLYSGRASGVNQAIGQAKFSYLSPQLVNFIREGIHNNISDFDLYKGDIFSLGMTVLETACLRQSTDCYDSNYNPIQSIVRDRLEFIASYYTKDFSDQLRVMLEFDPLRRKDCIEVWRMLSYDNQLSISPLKTPTIDDNVPRLSVGNRGMTPQSPLATNNLTPTQRNSSNSQIVENLFRQYNDDQKAKNDIPEKIYQINHQRSASHNQYPIMENQNCRKDSPLQLSADHSASNKKNSSSIPPRSAQKETLQNFSANTPSLAPINSYLSGSQPTIQSVKYQNHEYSSCQSQSMNENLLPPQNQFNNQPQFQQHPQYAPQNIQQQFAPNNNNNNNQMPQNYPVPPVNPQYLPQMPYPPNQIPQYEVPNQYGGGGYQQPVNPYMPQPQNQIYGMVSANTQNRGDIMKTSQISYQPNFQQIYQNNYQGSQQQCHSQPNEMEFSSIQNYGQNILTQNTNFQQQNNLLEPQKVPLFENTNDFNYGQQNAVQNNPNSNFDNYYNNKFPIEEVQPKLVILNDPRKHSAHTTLQNSQILYQPNATQVNSGYGNQEIFAPNYTAQPGILNQQMVVEHQSSLLNQPNYLDRMNSSQINYQPSQFVQKPNFNNQLPYDPQHTPQSQQQLPHQMQQQPQPSQQMQQQFPYPPQQNQLYQHPQPQPQMPPQSQPQQQYPPQQHQNYPQQHYPTPLPQNQQNMFNPQTPVPQYYPSTQMPQNQQANNLVRNQASPNQVGLNGQNSINNLGSSQINGIQNQGWPQPQPQQINMNHPYYQNQTNIQNNMTSNTTKRHGLNGGQGFEPLRDVGNQVITNPYLNFSPSYQNPNNRNYPVQNHGSPSQVLPYQNFNNNNNNNYNNKNSYGQKQNDIMCVNILSPRNSSQNNQNKAFVSPNYQKGSNDTYSQNQNYISDNSTTSNQVGDTLNLEDRIQFVINRSKNVRNRAQHLQ